MHTDILDSNVLETDASKAIVGERQYFKAFGDTLGTPKDDVGYTGHKFDSDLGLSYMQARYYDPVIGRFYSNDPVDAAAFIEHGNVQGFNRYAYANNNPFKYTDPDGHSPAFIVMATPPEFQDDINKVRGQGLKLAADNTPILGEMIAFVEIGAEIVQADVPVQEAAGLTGKYVSGKGYEIKKTNFGEIELPSKAKLIKGIVQGVIGEVSKQTTEKADEIVDNNQEMQRQDDASER